MLQEDTFQQSIHEQSTQALDLNQGSMSLNVVGGNNGSEQSTNEALPPSTPAEPEVFPEKVPFESFQFANLSREQQCLVNELRSQLDELHSVLNKQRAFIRYNRRFYARLREQVIHNPDDPLGKIITDLDQYHVIRRRINRQFPIPAVRSAQSNNGNTNTSRRSLYEILYDLSSTLVTRKLQATKPKKNLGGGGGTGRPRGRPPGGGKRGRPRRSYQPAMFTPEVELLVESNSPHSTDNNGSTTTNISRARKSKLAAESRLQSINAALNSVPPEPVVPRKRISKKSSPVKVKTDPPELSPEVLAKVEERIRKKTQAASWCAVNDPKAGILGRCKAKDQTSSVPKPKRERAPPLDIKPIYVCNIGTCQYETLMEADIKEHQRGHQEAPPYQCHICNDVFNDRSTFKDHRLIYHNMTDVVYKCSWPGCSFVKCFLERLKMHYKSHVAQPNIKCIWPGCEKMFRFKGNLQEHMRMHENERLYKCPHCQYSCNTSCNLRKHILLHERKRETAGGGSCGNGGGGSLSGNYSSSSQHPHHQQNTAVSHLNRSSMPDHMGGDSMGTNNMAMLSLSMEQSIGTPSSSTTSVYPNPPSVSSNHSNHTSHSPMSHVSVISSAGPSSGTPFFESASANTLTMVNRIVDPNMSDNMIHQYFQNLLHQ